MKIAVVLEAVFPDNKGGLERWYFHLASELSKHVDEVHYLNSAGVDGVRGKVTYSNITNYKWGYLEGGIRSIRQAFKFLLSIIKWTWNNQYDVIYISSVPILSIFAIPIIRIKRPKTIIVVEWLEYWPLKYWRSYKGNIVGITSWVVQLVALQFGDFRTTFIERTNHRIKNMNLPWIRKKTRLLPGLIDANMGIDFDVFLERNDIVFLGRLVEEKQPLFAISIIERYVEQGWEGTFWIIGTGPEEDKIKLAISRSAAGKQIKLLLNAPDSLVNEKFNRSFLLLHPSKREGYGLVCVEAAFKGLPTLLINYPENGAVDLSINPELVARSDDTDVIVNLIEFSRKNFVTQSQRAMAWSTKALEQRNLTKSVYEIHRLAK
jgi:glycosyltransferase involved in cell wall biosynthesis